MNWMTSGKKRLTKHQKARELRSQHFSGLGGQPSAIFRPKDHSRQSADVTRLKCRWAFNSKVGSRQRISVDSDQNNISVASGGHENFATEQKLNSGVTCSPFSGVLSMFSVHNEDLAVPSVRLFNDGTEVQASSDYGFDEATNQKFLSTSDQDFLASDYAMSEVAHSKNFNKYFDDEDVTRGSIEEISQNIPIEIRQAVEGLSLNKVLEYLYAMLAMTSKQEPSQIQVEITHVIRSYEALRHAGANPDAVVMTPQNTQENGKFFVDRVFSKTNSSSDSLRSPENLSCLHQQQPHKEFTKEEKELQSELEILNTVSCWKLFDGEFKAISEAICHKTPLETKQVISRNMSPGISSPSQVISMKNIFNAGKEKIASCPRRIVFETCIEDNLSAQNSNDDSKTLSTEKSFRLALEQNNALDKKPCKSNESAILRAKRAKNSASDGHMESRRGNVEEAIKVNALKEDTTLNSKKKEVAVSTEEKVPAWIITHHGRIIAQESGTVEENKCSCCNKASQKDLVADSLSTALWFTTINACLIEGSP